MGLGYSSGEEPNSESDAEDELVFTRCQKSTSSSCIGKFSWVTGSDSGHLTKMQTDMEQHTPGIYKFSRDLDPS